MVFALLVFFIQEATYHALGLALQVHLIARPVQLQLDRSAQAEFVICE